MDIYTLIESDHASARGLMDQILAAGSHASRVALFSKFREAVLSHNDAEASSLYVALDAHMPMRKMAERSRKEHEEADAMIASLTGTSLTPAEWEGKFIDLRRALLEHIEREESDVFAVARRTFSPRVAAELAVAMQQLKQMRTRLIKFAS